MKKASSPQRYSSATKVRDLKKKKFIEPLQASFSRVIDEDQESIDSNLSYYEVQNLVDRRQNSSGMREYLVKWKSYPDSQNTWEPVAHLKYIKNFVSEFDKQYERKQGMKKTKPSPQRRVNKMVKKGKKFTKPPFQKPINQVFQALQPKDMKPMKPRQKSMLKEDFTAYIQKNEVTKKENLSDSDYGSYESVPVAILGFRRRKDFDMNVLVLMSKLPGQREADKKMVLYSQLRVYFPELIIDFMEQNLIFEEPGEVPKRVQPRGEHGDHSDNVSDLTQNTQVS